MTRRDFVARSALLSALLCAPGAAWAALQETPLFARAVADGKLPKIEDRVPAEPAIVDASGKPGGQLRMLMASPKDTRMMVVYGYARLVGLHTVARSRGGHPQGDRRRRTAAALPCTCARE